MLLQTSKAKTCVFGGLKCPYLFEEVLHRVCDIHYKLPEVFYSEFSKFC